MANFNLLGQKRRKIFGRHKIRGKNGLYMGLPPSPFVRLDLRGQSTAVALSPRGKNATGQFVSVCDIPDNTQDMTHPSPSDQISRATLSRQSVQKEGAEYLKRKIQVGRTRRSVIETLDVGERKRSSFWLVRLHANLPLFREKKFQHKISRATLSSSGADRAKVGAGRFACN